jgi:hypothetical protein
LQESSGWREFRNSEEEEELDIIEEVSTPLESLRVQLEVFQLEVLD